MDLQAALAHASEYHVANVVGLQLHGRSIEVFRPRFSEDNGKCQIEHREGLLFQEPGGADMLDDRDLTEDAAALDFFVAPVTDAELDAIVAQSGEKILHRLLDGAPNPEQCESPKEKAAFTSWCISTLAHRNG